MKKIREVLIFLLLLFIFVGTIVLLLYNSKSKEKTGIIFDIQDGGKIILFKDSVDATDIHIAKLSTRKNSAVRGQWIENGITGKYAYTHKIILDKK